MLGIVFGVIYIVEFGSPIHPAIMLMIGAISFILGSAFFDTRGAGQALSLVGGGVIAVSSTFVITAVFGGILYGLDGRLQGWEWETLVSMLAVCMIASVIILKFILPPQSRHSRRRPI